MGRKRIYYKYQFKRGNKILHGGITEDLDRREGEHQRDINSKGHIKQVGRRTTEEAARQWEKEKGYTQAQSEPKPRPPKPKPRPPRT